MHLVEITDTQHALGGNATIGLVLPADAPARRLQHTLWRTVFQFEKRFSRFLPSSELSLFNASAGLKTPVSDAFAAVLKTALQLAEQTGGLCNPFILPALQRTGYIHSAAEGYQNDPAPDYTERQVVDSNKLELGDGWARIPYGTAIDIGGFGKGYLADMLGGIAREQGAVGYWIELSGDIATYGHDAAGQPITIAVQAADTAAAGRYVVVCPAEPFAVATSGTFARVAHAKTIKGHHIIDPRTSQPAETDMLLATVCDSSAIIADVFASCALIVGSKQAPTWLKAHDSPEYLLQWRSGSGIATNSHGTHILIQKGAPAHA